MPPLDVAGGRARLDHGGAFPVLAEAFVIVQGELGRDRDLGGARVGTQAQVGAEDVAIGGALVQEFDEIARGQANEELRRLKAVAQAGLVALVEDDEVDVAGEIEFAGAVLAHGEHDQAGMAMGGGIVRRGEPVALFPGGAKQIGAGRITGGIGDVGKSFAGAHDRPMAGQIGEGNEEGCFGLEGAQRCHPRLHGRKVGGGGLVPQRVDHLAQMAIWRICQNGGEARGRLHRQHAQIPRAAEHGAEEIADGGIAQLIHLTGGEDEFRQFGFEVCEVGGSQCCIVRQWLTARCNGAQIANGLEKGRFGARCHDRLFVACVSGTASGTDRRWRTPGKLNRGVLRRRCGCRAF